MVIDASEQHLDNDKQGNARRSHSRNDLASRIGYRDRGKAIMQKRFLSTAQAI